MDIKRAWHSFRFATMFSSLRRGDYVRKHNIFGKVGENVRLPAGIIPLKADYIYLGNNIEIASGVKLIPHDAIHSVFNSVENSRGNYKEHIGKIEIYDNVFIGANALILGPCTIGPNAIVGAGAVCTKNVPPRSIVGGVPAKVIGSFDELMEKRYHYDN